MTACPSHKKIFSSLEQAEDALIETRIKFGNGPVAVYRCEDCGQYHLTSQGTMNERLASFIEEGKLKRHREANYWLDKLKKGSS